MTAPYQEVEEANVPSVSTAGADQFTIVTQAQYDGSVSKVEYVPSTGITGVNTNTRTVSLVNKGQAGSGSTVVATLTFNAGTNATADNEVTVPLSGTAADAEVEQGDTLEWHSTHVGTGITDPGGLVRVTVDRG